MSSQSNQIMGFHHVGIVVPDLRLAITFYRELFGYEVISESSWDEDNRLFNQIVGLERSAARFCMLRGNNSYIELFQYSEPAYVDPVAPGRAFQPGYRHLSFAVNDVATALDRCIDLGGKKINEPMHVPGRAAGVYCYDPFGNLLEFVQPIGSFPKPFHVD